MVRCPDCETPNSVDSKFCRFCGAPLPEEERIDAQVKLNELIAEGNKLFNEGRTDEALLIAESAISSSPNDTRALSLKGMCLERAGYLADALELYERVVELNPDSPLDKIKVTHVRNRLAAKAAEVPPPNRRIALIGASAAIVFVMAVGSIIAAGASGSTPKTASLKNDTVSDGSQVTGFDNAAIQTPAQSQPASQGLGPSPDLRPSTNDGPPLVPPITPSRNTVIPFPVVPGPIEPATTEPTPGTEGPKPTIEQPAKPEPGGDPPPPIAPDRSARPSMASRWRWSTWKTAAFCLPAPPGKSWSKGPT